MNKGVSARTRSRELLVQALYQMQIADHDYRELLSQFRERPDYLKVDQPYFDELLQAICGSVPEIEASLARYADRPLDQLDPVEKSILYIGHHELSSVPEVPYRVIINEAVNLTRRFGAADGHKYINALLDRASKELRAIERS